MAIRLEGKRANEVRDYKHDWTAFLGTDTIFSRMVTAVGATITSSSNDTTSVTMWIGAGVDGVDATITQTIVTVGGRTETEIFLLPINADEVVSLAQAKEYLRVRDTEEDAKIAAMIPRARLWVEDHTGLALIRRTFVEQRTPRFGVIQLFKGPLVSVSSVAYTDANGAAQTYTGSLVRPPLTLIAPAATWPVLPGEEKFAVTYIAGYAPGFVDDRLIGAMLALIEGEFSEGFAYPAGAVESAERCCGYLRTMVA